MSKHTWFATRSDPRQAPATAILFILGLGILMTAACVGPGPGAPATPIPVPTQPSATPGPSPTPGPTADYSHLPTCDTPETLALGLGLTQFESEAEARSKLGTAMLYADPATLPAGSKVVESYYSANIVRNTDYKQSTLSMTYQVGEEEKFISILYYNTLNPFQAPPEEHEAITLRGGRPAFLFRVPWVAGQHSVWWDDGCRQVSVIADLPAEEVIRIAEGLSHTAPPLEP